MGYGKYSIEAIKRMFGEGGENSSEWNKYSADEQVEIVSNCGYGVLMIQSVEHPTVHSYLVNYGDSLILL